MRRAAQRTRKRLPKPPTHIEIVRWIASLRRNNAYSDKDAIRLALIRYAKDWPEKTN